jgi:hypothetical protein
MYNFDLQKLKKSLFSAKFYLIYLLKRLQFKYFVAIIYPLLKILKPFLPSLFILLYLSSCSMINLKGGNRNFIRFAGYDWKLKQGNYLQGPGNNIFSSESKNIWVDWRGQLHLNIAPNQDSIWHSSELYCLQQMGYGRYEFQLKGQLSQLDPFSVLGLFTWDPKSFSSQANSEIDIEFSRWGYPLSPSLLYYTVHPVSSGKLNLERMYKSPLTSSTWNGISTHLIEWRDTSISWSSYTGKEAVEKNRTDHFHYSFKNKKRLKRIGDKSSDNISVPQPGSETSARINYWLMNGRGAPFGAECPEIIIRDFSYTAY